MSGRIPREFIDDLLVRVDIVDLIDAHVPLKKAGNSYVARCPFHTEKSPSFSVNRNKQFYHCFGCGAGGNAISFLMEFSHLEFVEAIEDLAGFVGLSVPRIAFDNPIKKQDFNALYEVLEQVAVYYVEQLRSHAQSKIFVDYLKRRGLNGQVAKQFSIGCAPDEWDGLSSRFDKKLLIDVGMLVESDKGKQYDRFRGRLMFPIRDRRKRVIGFGGRVVDDSLPKYLNSPETMVFSKGKELYGLSELLQAQSKPRRILIVEGYMDVLALAQFGLYYSVAALGTATSKIQLDLLFRFTSELVFCFDGDVAGTKAAWRTVQEAFPSLRDGRQVKVMILPEGEDPDSLIREEGLAAFECRVTDSQVLSDYYFDVISDDLNLSTVEGRAQLLTEAKPSVEKIPAGNFRDMMFLKLNQLSGGSVVDKPIKPGSYLSDKKEFSVSGLEEGSTKSLAAKRVIALLLQQPKLIEIVEQRETEVGALDFPGAVVFKELLAVIENLRPQNAAVLVEYFRGTARESMVNKLVNWDLFILDEGVEAEFSGALDKLFLQASESVLDRLLSKEKEKGLSLDEMNQLQKLLTKKI